jgi:hypothetical protein
MRCTNAFLALLHVAFLLLLPLLTFLKSPDKSWLLWIWIILAVLALIVSLVCCFRCYRKHRDRNHSSYSDEISRNAIKETPKEKSSSTNDLVHSNTQQMPPHQDFAVQSRTPRAAHHEASAGNHDVTLRQRGGQPRSGIVVLNVLPDPEPEESDQVYSGNSMRLQMPQ